MRSSSVIILLFIGVVGQEVDEDKQVDYEATIKATFKAAYGNRSDELQDFFNRTFSAGGNASDVAERFEAAWDSASEGVKKFVNETYTNISKIMQGDEGKITETVSEPIASLSQDASGNNNSTESTLDTAWNYFKSVFGVSPEHTPSPKGLKFSHQEESAALPEEPAKSNGGIYLGIMTMIAAVFLVFQATLNRNSLFNKEVHRASPQVPSGYVRIT